MFKLITDDLHLKKYFGQFSEIFGNIIHEFMYGIRDYPVLIRSNSKWHGEACSEASYFSLTFKANEKCWEVLSQTHLKKQLSLNLPLEVISK